MKKNLYLEYFLICFKMGAICFGGGYGMMPMMEKELHQKRNYVSKQEMTDIFALAQSLPGLISLNTIILVGTKKRGTLLAFVGSLGLVIPSLVTMCLVALAYAQIISNPFVEAVFVGVRAFVVALLITAVVRLYKAAVVDSFTMLLCVISAVVLVLSEVLAWDWFNPIYTIIAAAFIGVGYQTFIKKERL